jgi:hypothetical protein
VRSNKGRGHKFKLNLNYKLKIETLPKNHKDKAFKIKKSMKKRKGSTCWYFCCEKGHFASSCLNYTLSNLINVYDDYSLSKDKGTNVFAEFVETQSGFKKRSIWVAEPIVTTEESQPFLPLLLV